MFVYVATNILTNVCASRDVCSVLGLAYTVEDLQKAF